MKFWKREQFCFIDNQELYTLTAAGDEVTPDLFREELKQHAGDGHCHNSPGGDVFGLAIYNALVNHNGNVTVRVDG